MTQLPAMTPTTGTTNLAAHRCTRCGTEKPFTEFYRMRGAKNGLQSWCKCCCLSYQRQRRGARPAVAVNELPLTFLPARGSAAIAIRHDRLVIVTNLPADFTSAEANHIRRILYAHAGSPDAR